MAVGLVIGTVGGYASVQLPWPETLTPFGSGAAPTARADTPSSPESIAAVNGQPSFDEGAVTSQPDTTAASRESPSGSPVPTATPGAPGKAADAPAGPSDTPGTGSLDVASYPSGAVVSLDGRVVGLTPLLLRNVPDGTHVIGIEAPGFSRWATSVDVSAGWPMRVRATLGE